MFQGYSSRLLAETWDSTNLYWARLADEMGYPAVALNRLAPELTVRMVAKIFATDLNDWPALLRAMRETAEEFRQSKPPSLPPNAGSSQP
jgi:cytochrome P450